MTILEISDEEHLERIDRPFNPPEEDVSDEDFEREYYALYELIEPLMARHGVNDAFASGDYYLEPSICRSRGLGLEINNPAIVTRALLDELKTLVAKHAPGWEIYLRSDNFDYGIFIGPTEILLQRNNRELLKHLFQ